MKVKTNPLIIFVAAVLVLGTLSHGCSSRKSPDEERANMQNQAGTNPNVSGAENGQQGMTNEATSQGETPRRAQTLQPTVIRHVGWSWVLIGGLIGFFLGRLTNHRRRPYGKGGDIRRDRVA